MGRRCKRKWRRRNSCNTAILREALDITKTRNVQSFSYCIGKIFELHYYIN